MKFTSRMDRDRIGLASCCCHSCVHIQSISRWLLLALVGTFGLRLSFTKAFSEGGDSVTVGRSCCRCPPGPASKQQAFTSRGVASSWDGIGLFKMQRKGEKWEKLLWNQYINGSRATFHIVDSSWRTLVFKIWMCPMKCCNANLMIKFSGLNQLRWTISCMRCVGGTFSDTPQLLGRKACCLSLGPWISWQCVTRF